MKVIFICLILLFCACSNSSIQIEDEAIPKDNLSIILPSEVVIGDKVKIYNSKFGDNYKKWDILFSGNNVWAYPDSGKMDTLYASIPFKAMSGEVKLYKGSNLDSTKIEKITVKEGIIDFVNVKWSNLNHKLTKKNSTFEYATQENEVIWWSEKSGDTVKIFGGRSVSEEWIGYYLYFLDNGKNNLPTYLEGYARYHRDYGPIYFYQYDLDSAYIKIQSWNSDSLVCGKVISSVSDYNNDYNNYIFWVEF